MVSGGRVLFCIFIYLAHITQGYTYRSGRQHRYANSNCPRVRQIPPTQSCMKRCNVNSDCRGKNKECLCDGPCGMSCVRRHRKCSGSSAIVHGHYEITPYNQFDAKLRYTCEEGFILKGTPERRCQGDGSWSAKAPSCETQGVCGEPPTIEHASHNGMPGQKKYPIRAQLKYTCWSGYQQYGHGMAMCVEEGRWVGARMACTARICPHPGGINNGYRQGNIFRYPHQVTYHCNEGYQLIGQAVRKCEGDGTWSASLPTCKAIKCARLSAPHNGNMNGYGHNYGDKVTFSCKEGFKLTGSSLRHCQHDGKWSGQHAACELVNCGFPENFYNGYFDGETTYGSVILYRCQSRTTFDGPEDARCRSDGTWSNPLPKCWKDCVKPEIRDADVGESNNVYDDRHAAHNQTLAVTCKTGFIIDDATHPVCYNGTWSKLPKCLPAPCTSRPPSLENGMVRYHRLEHGDIAKYRCNTGYMMDGHRGSKMLTCLNGVWRGDPPACVKKRCKYPGKLENGDILLVGEIGKYMYMDYVSNVEHQDQIEYQCDKTTRRVGPAGATCVDGRWSPPAKPRCVPAQHMKDLYVFRGKRDLSKRRRTGASKL